MGIKLSYLNGQTPIDEEEKNGLIIKTINTQKELNEFEQLNIEKAVEWTIHKNLKKDIILSKKFIKDLHKKMFGEVWNWAGTFRTSEKNLGIKWTQIEMELKILLDDTHYWINNNTHSCQEIAIRFKHRIVQIHCFPNGNGRHSRMMADIIITSIFKKEIFTWHKANIAQANTVRKKYIKALKQADNGNIKPLLKFAQN